LGGKRACREYRAASLTYERRAEEENPGINLPIAVVEEKETKRTLFGILVTQLL